MARDFQYEREMMVKRQLVARGIRDAGVLEAMRKVPRHRFVDENLASTAYHDNPLPVGEGQTISQPYMVALMTEALDLRGHEKTLEVGTGSGYQTAILAELSDQVYSVERIGELLTKAKKVLEELGYTNILFKAFDGTLGWEEHAPYDAIIVTAGAPEVPKPFLEQLDRGGRLVIPVGDQIGQELVKVTKKNGLLDEEQLGGCRFVDLVGEHGWEE
jgi:protein-L-isoaspartate(D-aspartate) O-methyltransferase